MSVRINEIDDYVYPREIDWAQITLDISQHGMTYSGISKCLGVGWSTVQRWRKGAEPRTSFGNALLLVHARTCGGELTRQRVGEAK